jgi:2-keto-4-pentenoate hydratase
LAAKIVPGSDKFMAVVVEEGAATVTVNCPVAAAAPVATMARGFGEQVTPGGRAEQVTLTVCVPVEPAAGVTVIVDVALLPAVTGVGVSAEAVSVKLFVTVTVTAAEVDVA